ncbi:response regulator [Gramella sp. GC03-9]|uniref:Response regulator n=1 Tax=Christiangramia oceanisediminis TaxID=2920386 RepID=A0A9X2KWS8_9FLAO|nr:response regulator [Gramella oceanisediminis]MCP9199918.1 response regulator [Gramella oceanisediminis]
MLRTLIIDDDPIVSFLQHKIVSKSGLDSDPRVFKKPEEALCFLREDLEDEGRYLIMLDINMPSMNGWKFLEELEKLEAKYQCHVVMVTSSIDRKDKRQAANNDLVVDFIEKPVSARHCAKLKGISVLADYFQEN